MTRGLRSKSMAQQVWGRYRFSTETTVTLPYSDFAFCWHCLVRQMLLHHVVESHLCAAVPLYKLNLRLSHVGCLLGMKICFSVPLIYQFESHATEFTRCQWLIFHFLLKIVTKYNCASEVERDQSSLCKLHTLKNTSKIW